jgi:hypothetical protein
VAANRLQLERRIAADPTSTALLLAAPTAMELWPGLRRVAEVGGRVVVEADIDDVPAAASVRAQPPQRTPLAYLTRFEWAGPGLPAVTAELSLRYLSTASGEQETLAELVLDCSGFEGTVLSEGTLRDQATTFLENLALAAERRNRAA